MKIGVLGLQGDFIEHIAVLNSLGITAVDVRLPGQLAEIDGLIIPGGESTTISKLLADFRLTEKLGEMGRTGFPIMGTCAGMIMLASRVTGNSVVTLGLMDITVNRNAYGRQVDSFEAEIPVAALGARPFHGVFIRAPMVEEAGAGVTVLARLPGGRIVAARQDRLLALAFHPELTADTRFHAYFIAMIAGNAA
jgi:pyridoxal 5'-phosphate synthase pdxT subunit